MLDCIVVSKNDSKNHKNRCEYSDTLNSRFCPTANANKPAREMEILNNLNCELKTEGVT